MKNDGGSAFPISGYKEGFVPGLGGTEIKSDGMSLRDYFAAAAIPGMMEWVRQWRELGKEYKQSDIAVAVYQLADAMLAERAK